jgi:hypothetical protein
MEEKNCVYADDTNLEDESMNFVLENTEALLKKN